MVVKKDENESCEKPENIFPLLLSLFLYEREKLAVGVKTETLEKRGDGGKKVTKIEF